MDDHPVLFHVRYFYDGQIIAERNPTQIVPRQGDMVCLPDPDGSDGATEFFTIETVVWVIPDSDAHVASIDIQLEMQ